MEHFHIEPPEEAPEVREADRDETVKEMPTAFLVARLRDASRPSTNELLLT